MSNTEIINIEVDANKALQAISEANSAIKELTDANKQLAAEMEADTSKKAENTDAIEVNNAKIRVLTESVRTYQKEIRNSIKEQQGDGTSLKELRATLSNLTKQYDELSAAQRNGAEGNQLQQQIQKTITEISSAEQATGRFQRSVGNYANALKDLRQRYKENLSEVARLKGEHKEGTEEFKKASAAAGQLAKQLRESKATAAAMSQEFAGLNTAVGTVQLIAGAFEGAVGAMTLFGVDSKQAAEAQKELTAAIALGNGVQNVANALKADGNLILGITKIQMTAATAAETVHTAAQGKGIIATKAATIAQALFNAIAKANPYVLLATALITVVGALAAFAIGNSAAKEKQKEMNDEIQRGTENLKDLDFQYQRRIEKFKAEGATQKAILTQQMNDAKSQVMNVQRQYNDYLDQLAQDGVEKYSDEQQQQIDTYESSLKERKQAYIKAADAVSNYTIQSNRERAAKAAADEKAASDKQTAANKAAAEKRKKDSEEAYRNQVEAIRAMEDESINLISNDYERETAKLRTEHRRQIEDLREKLRTEKNLNKTAREAINRQINMLDTAFQRAQLQLIQKHNQDEEAANNERTQRRIEEWNKSAEAIEDAQQRAHEAIINQARINGASEIEIDRLTAQAKIEEANNLQKKLDETDTDFQQRKLAKQVEAAEASKKVTEDEQAEKEKITETHTQARIGAEQSMQNAMQQTLNATKADTNTRKAIAVANIAINEAESIAAAVASATKGDPYTIALRIAAAVAGVVAAMMQASSALSGASGFATGGYVSGAGTGTSDSIPVRLSNGESVINANATSQFAPLLSALNQSAGGAPITSQSDNNYLARQFAAALSVQPSPVVSVTEFNKVSDRMTQNVNISEF